MNRGSGRPRWAATPGSLSMNPLGVSHTETPQACSPLRRRRNFILWAFSSRSGCLSPTVRYSVRQVYCSLLRLLKGKPPGSVCGSPVAPLQTALSKLKAACCCVQTNALLTCCVALHLNDTFRLLANLPGVEGPNSNGHFYRRPRHVCVRLGLSLRFLRMFLLEKTATITYLHLLNKQNIHS